MLVLELFVGRAGAVSRIVRENILWEDFVATAVQMLTS